MMAPGLRASPDALDTMLADLLHAPASGAGAAPGVVGKDVSAAELDELLGEFGADAELWHEPTLFGSLAPGLQCSEACKRPGQRCLDPGHPPHCTKCVAQQPALQPPWRWRWPGSTAPCCALHLQPAPPHAPAALKLRQCGRR